jgi:hypothetical protein
MSGICLPTPRRICGAVELSGVPGALDYTSGTDSLDLNFLGNDQTNPRSSRGPSDFDRKHRFVASFTFRPPAWRSAPRVVRQFLSDWQLSGVTIRQSGLPITVTDRLAGSVFGNLVGFSRASCIGQNRAAPGSVTARLNGYFNLSAFTAPPKIGGGTGFGNRGVGILRGPSQRNLHLGIQRTFPLAESIGLDFRAEFFNFTNTPKFGQPFHDFAAAPDPPFSVISSTVGNPRIIQFVLKLHF